MRDGKGMNVFRKLPLIPQITKDLTLRSSFGRKARISFAFNTIALAVRLSPVLSTSARIQLGLRRASSLGPTNLTRSPDLRWCNDTQKVKLLIPGHIPGSFCKF